MAPEVARAAWQRPLAHREESFRKLFRSATERLLHVANVGADFEAVLIAGSGTAAIESMITSVVGRGERVLTISNGHFGERLAAIARSHERVVESLEHPWGAPIDTSRLASALDRRPVAVVVVHHETSTGMLNRLPALAELSAARGVPLLVDAVSSFPVDAIDLSHPGISFVAGSAGKAVGAYPGLSFVLGRRRAFDSLESGRGYYLDLARYVAFARRGETPHTPAVPLVAALDAALGLMSSRGVEAFRAHHAERARIVRDGLRNHGVRMWLSSEVEASNVLTTFVAARPDGLRQALYDRGYVTYAGKGALAATCLQIATLGALSEAHVRAFVDVLGEELREERSSCSAESRRS